MQVSADVLSVLSAAEVEGPHLVLTGQLDRKLYERTNKVLEAAGGKWNRKAKAHIFDGDASDRIDQIILSGSVIIPKDEFNFFPTPAELAERVVAAAGVRPGDLILEPSAGLGAIATAAIGAGGIVDCYELMPANAEALRQISGIRSVCEADFLLVEPKPIYSAVTMNPPFAKQADIRHVVHAHRFLCPGGTLTAVLSAGVLYRQDRLAKSFRDLVDECGGHIEPLPEGSFKSSGTMVNTVLVTIPSVAS